MDTDRPNRPRQRPGDGAGWRGGGGLGQWYRLRQTPITNLSSSAEIGFFCTTSEEAGPYVLSVSADPVQGPIGLLFDTAVGADCTNGYVGPYGVPIYVGNAGGSSLPQCNPGGGSNELQLHRPTYVLDVVHSRFSLSPLAPRE